jgi:hypothetical protein
MLSISHGHHGRAMPPMPSLEEIVFSIPGPTVLSNCDTPEGPMLSHAKGLFTLVTKGQDK